MTTIAWDGKSLASDSRQTHKGMRASDDTVKLITFTGDAPMVVIGREVQESIIAMACSGVVPSFEGALDILKEHGWTTFQTIYSNLWRTKLKTSNLAFSMLIVTEKHLVTVRAVDGIPLTIDHQPRHTPAAIGSGGKVANFLMTQFAFSAPLAIAASILTDDGSGGYIQHMDVDGSSVKGHPRIHLSDRNDIRRQIQKRMAEYVIPRKVEPIEEAPLLSIPGGRFAKRVATAKKTTRAKK